MTDPEKKVQNFFCDTYNLLSKVLKGWDICEFQMSKMECKAFVQANCAMKWKVLFAIYATSWKKKHYSEYDIG